jgi:hypothetical protein
VPVFRLSLLSIAALRVGNDALDYLRVRAFDFLAGSVAPI